MMNGPDGSRRGNEKKSDYGHIVRLDPTGFAEGFRVECGHSWGLLMGRLYFTRLQNSTMRIPASTTVILLPPRKFIHFP